MIRGAAIPDKRILREPDQGRVPAAPRPRTAGALRASTAPTTGSGLSARVAEAADLPWLQTWAAHLGLPAPRSRRVRSFILLQDWQRVGYLALQREMMDAEGAREPVLWVLSAFLVPALRGQGLILKFGEILCAQFRPEGKVGFRVAADNVRMQQLATRRGWQRRRSTQRYTDFVVELDTLFRASWRA